jgi:molybdenum-dependent DNA-binding transcriptional regulator ModE
MENWDDLRIFLAVAQSGSLTVAAQVLKIDPATVSRRIARLEQTHATPLFSKSPKGYESDGSGAWAGGACGRRASLLECGAWGAAR